MAKNGNPLKKLEREAKNISKTDVANIATAGAYDVTRQTMRSDVGRDVGAIATFGGTEGTREREARISGEEAQAKQEALLATQQAEATSELEDRKKRMLKSRQGRRSLLSGGVKGVENREIIS